MRKYQKHIVFFLISIFIGGFSAINAGKDLNYDLLNYHYQNAYSFVNHRVDKDIAPSGLLSYQNPVIDVPTYVLISNTNPRFAAGVLGMIQGLNIWIIFEIMLVCLKKQKAKDTTKVVISALVATVSFFGAATAAEVGGTMTDNMASIFCLAAVWLLLYSFNIPSRHLFTRVKVFSKNPERTLRLMAFFVMGLGIGLKLTGLIFGIGLFIAGLLVGKKFIEKIKESFYHGVSLVIGMSISGGFWFYKMWSDYQNPVFPFYNGIFKSDYYVATSFHDDRWRPDNLLQALFYPFYIIRKQVMTSELPFRDSRFAVVFALFVITACAFLLTRYTRHKILKKVPTYYKALWIFFIVSYLVWVKTFFYYRYLVALEILSITVIASLLYTLIRKFSYATTALALVIIFLLVSTVPINWGRKPWTPTYFGIQKSDFNYLDNATILITSYVNPSFIVPYFPESSRTIRIKSEFSSPEKGTPAMQAVMRSAVDERIKADSAFYAIRTDDEIKQSDEGLSAYGFTVENCNLLPVYSGAPYPYTFRICSLKINNM